MTPNSFLRELDFNDNAKACSLYGNLNQNLLSLERNVGVTIHARGTNVKISGQRHDVELVAELLLQLYHLIVRGYPVYSSDFIFGLKVLETKPNAQLDKIFLDKVYITTQNRVVSPKTGNQKLYIDSIRHNDIVFGTGPAGTGKTYLAVAMAAAALAAGQTRSIILTKVHCFDSSFDSLRPYI